MLIAPLTHYFFSHSNCIFPFFGVFIRYMEEFGIMPENKQLKINDL